MQTIDLDLIDLASGGRVLDLGCGEGRHTLAVAMVGGVFAVGLDRSREGLQTSRRKHGELRGAGVAVDDIDLTVGDALHLPFADARFDRVICSEVLEHIPDYRAALGEVDRVLRPGGILAVSVPRFGPEWVCWRLSDAYHNVEGGHVRIFRSRQLRRDIEQLGMRCYRRHWAHALHAPFWWLKCLLWERRDRSRLVALYHRFLVWDLMRRPAVTRVLEMLLNPLIGKSVVLYFRKPAVSGRRRAVSTGGTVSADAPRGARFPAEYPAR
ncbi:MAG TPA: methyltransferase domain-containing protein [Gammaproteobacteria bacterium]|nr:methyltransferase domain-containing protein [Gammaproteobacteria bacterium]